MARTRMVQGLVVAALVASTLAGVEAASVRSGPNRPAGATGVATYRDTVMADSPDYFWRMGSSGPQSSNEVASNGLPVWGVNGSVTPSVAGGLLGDSNTAYRMLKSHLRGTAPRGAGSASVEGWVCVEDIGGGFRFGISGTCSPSGDLLTVGGER